MLASFTLLVWTCHHQNERRDLQAVFSAFLEDLLVRVFNDTLVRERVYLCVSDTLCVWLVCKIKKINLLENSRGFKFPKGFSTDSKFLTRTWLFPVKRDLKPWRRDFPIKGNLKFRIRDFENQTNYLYVANAVTFKTRGNRKPITFWLSRVRWRNIFNFFPVRWIE